MRELRVENKVGTVVIMPDGRRICLNHVHSYTKGGDCGIHFLMGPGHTVAWTCPVGWAVKGIWKNAEQKEREEAVEELLDQIDGFFKVRDWR